MTNAVTRPFRRHKGTKSGASIPGLRLEADVAQALTGHAREETAGDVAAMVRMLLHKGLGISVDVDDTPRARIIAGLVLCKTAGRALQAHAKRETNGNVAAMARHLVRVGLGWPVDESRRREEMFARIAKAKRELYDAEGL